MKKLCYLIFLLPLSTYAEQGYLQPDDANKIVRFSFVMQNWKIDGLDDRIAEGTFPIELIYPLNSRLNLQIYHSPAISNYGDIELHGFSDTWIKSTYLLNNEKMMINGGVGIPTGTTNLNNESAALSALLTQDIFKFGLPVFGQGFSANVGIAIAYPVNENFVLGSGVDFTYQGNYEFLQYKFDPGNQLSLNAGFDYNVSTNIKFNFDFIYTTYSKDKIDDIKNQIAPKFVVKSGLQLIHKNKMLLFAGRIRKNGKNETSFGSSVLVDSLNSNITQLELDATYKIKLTEHFSFDILFDGRSYIENKFRNGQGDIFGGGVRNTIKLTPNVQVSVLFKSFFGDSYFNYIKEIHKITGIEFKIMTMIAF